MCVCGGGATMEIQTVARVKVYTTNALDTPPLTTSPGLDAPAVFRGGGGRVHLGARHNGRQGLLRLDWLGGLACACALGCVKWHALPCTPCLFWGATHPNRPHPTKNQPPQPAHQVTVATILEAATSLLSKGWAPRRTLLFTFGQDEEVGGGYGAGGSVWLLLSFVVFVCFVGGI